MNLYKLINQLGTYWVSANDPTEAETKLKKVLDAGDGYGYSSKRKVTEIHLIAEEITHDDNSKSWPYNLTDKYFLL